MRNRLEPLISEPALYRLLQRGVANGRWTVEDLDQLSPGTELLVYELARHPDKAMNLLAPTHRNPLRETHNSETVETISPRDLDPAGQKPAVLRGNSPVLPERSPDTAFSHEHLQLRHEPLGEEENREYDF